jgi:hypothetical protein
MSAFVVVSCCVSAQAANLKYTVRLACDKKEITHRILQMAYPHMVSATACCCCLWTIDEVIKGSGDCRSHCQSCTLDSTAEVDMVIIGAPCQPFSAMRDKAKTLPHNHADWHVLFDDFMAYLDRWNPKSGICEQVSGFAHPVEPGFDDQGRPLPSSWMNRFVCLLRARRYLVACVRLDNGIWCDIPRDRLSM